MLVRHGIVVCLGHCKLQCLQTLRDFGTMPKCTFFFCFWNQACLNHGFKPLRTLSRKTTYRNGISTVLAVKIMPAWTPDIMSKSTSKTASKTATRKDPTWSQTPNCNQASNQNCNSSSNQDHHARTQPWS